MPQDRKADWIRRLLRHHRSCGSFAGHLRQSVLFAVCRSSVVPQKAKVKPVAEKHQSKSELGAELIRLTRSWLDPSIVLRVIVDGGYSNKQLLQVAPRECILRERCASNAALYAVAPQAPTSRRGRPRKKGERLPCPKSLFASDAISWEWILITLYGKETIVSVHRFEGDLVQGRRE